MFKCPAHIGSLTHNELCRLVAKLDAVDLTRDHRVQLEHFAGVHKEHDFLIGNLVCIASDQITLNEIQIEVNFGSHNLVAYGQRIGFSFAHCRGHLTYLLSRI